jgi:hypothetical protein
MRGGPVHIEAEVLGGRAGRAARVDRHADPQVDPAGPRRLRERTLSEDRRRKGFGAGAEDGGYLVPENGVDDAACLLDGLGEEPTMLVHRIRVLVTQRLQEPRRAFDVREEEGDGLSRYLAHRLAKTLALL